MNKLISSLTYRLTNTILMVFLQRIMIKRVKLRLTILSIHKNMMITSTQTALNLLERVRKMLPEVIFLELTMITTEIQQTKKVLKTKLMSICILRARLAMIQPVKATQTISKTVSASLIKPIQIPNIRSQSEKFFNRRIQNLILIKVPTVKY